MTGYAEEYIALLNRQLSRVAVTVDNGKEISVDEGLEIWAERVRDVQENTKGLLFFCGNGASASMAEHMSHDWFQNGVVNTTTCAELSHVTAISNDISYEDVYAYCPPVSEIRLKAGSAGKAGSGRKPRGGPHSGRKF